MADTIKSLNQINDPKKVMCYIQRYFNNKGLAVHAELAPSRNWMLSIPNYNWAVEFANNFQHQGNTEWLIEPYNDQTIIIVNLNN